MKKISKISFLLIKLFPIKKGRKNKAIRRKTEKFLSEMTFSQKKILLEMLEIYNHHLDYEEAKRWVEKHLTIQMTPAKED